MYSVDFLLTSNSQASNNQRDSQQQHQGVVSPKYAWINFRWCEKARDGENSENIEDVRTHDITDREIRLSFKTRG